MKRLYSLLYCIFSFVAYTAHAQSPVEFIENKGQWGDWFAYKAETRGGDVLLEKDGFRFILADKSNNVRLDSFHHCQTSKNPTLRFHAYKLTFEGSATSSLIGLKPQKTYYNYYLGNDQSQWKSGIHPNYTVDYQWL